ncbi:nitroreductase family protein [Propioniciclava sp. MC1595]|uniref:nitroreductase family protein n=1 Tax=Propioniciclava sp. MC1595 TaxID=2760308 RepID=UPI0016623A44|nr:nitroreductase family protein [Propioniciclava sp. MC1595]MBB1496247.1 nitroreductase family protein [Propioniciclava sp. MC1595]QTE24794.1 nitroreductase family protein [Propioniciclava sp. MC1595]
MTPAATATRNATDLPIAPLLAQRWSPRGFDADHVINSDELVCIVEAARWAPSAGNTQPWAFAAARRGTEAFAAIHATLAGFNQVWTPAASAHATAQVEHLGLNAHQMGGFDADALRTALDLPEGVRPLVVMAVGRHDDSDAVAPQVRERDAAARSRLPLAEVLLVAQ